MSSWIKVKLSDVTTKIGDGLHGTPKYDENGEYYFINGSNLLNGKIVIIDESKRVSKDEFLKYQKELNDRTILVSINGTLGNIAVYNGENIVLGKSVCYLNVISNVNRDYIRYILSSGLFQEYIHREATGSTIKNVSLKMMRNFEFSLPEIETQNYIAEVLGGLDKKIQLNTQINQTLEQIAQTIFKSWFIDFDPVHAKANALASGQAAEQATQAAMAVISGKNTQELHRLQTANPEQYQQLWEIAEPFPSGFDEEGVPRGWEEKFFGELLENTIGGDWGKDEVDEKHTEKVSILRGTDLPDVYKGNDKDVPTRFVEQKKLKSRKLQYSDIVIEVSGGSKNQPTGRSLLITDKLLSRFNNPIVPASFCRLFRPKSENYGYLLALHLQIIYQQGKTWEYQNQSTGISNFQTTHFLETEKVILPTNKTLMYFAEMVNPIFDKIYSDENQRLAEIRDELLPKLLSGEV